MWEQLIEDSKGQVMPGISYTLNPDKGKRGPVGCKARAKWRAKRRQS